MRLPEAVSLLGKQALNPQPKFKTKRDGKNSVPFLFETVHIAEMRMNQRNIWCFVEGFLLTLH